MAEIKVTSGVLKEKASRLRQLNSQFKSQVSQLVSQESTLNGQWEGEARDAFHTAFMRDRQQWDRFSQVVEEYARALDKDADNYDRAERMNRQTATERTYH